MNSFSELTLVTPSSSHKSRRIGECCLASTGTAAMARLAASVGRDVLPRVYFGLYLMQEDWKNFGHPLAIVIILAAKERGDKSRK
jgi:hypothetical protein